MRSIVNPGCLAAALLSVTACVSAIEDWGSVPTRRAPEVLAIEHGHTVTFEAGETGLSEDQRQRLDAFLASIGARSGSPAALAAGAALPGAADRRRRVVAAYLRLRGLNPDAAVASAAELRPTPDTVRVAVPRHVVSLPGCPDWSDRPGRTWNNSVSSNWGCATSVNFGLMVAEPSDLVNGRRPGPMDGEFAVLAIERYRAGETKPLLEESAASATPAAAEGAGSER
jgi:pilus assembly protein CpaD